MQQDQNGGYRWGRVYGGIDICAWTFSAALSQGPPTQDVCRHDHRKVEGFTNGEVGTNSADNDGLPAQFTPTAPGCNTYPDGSVPGFGNVQPWLVPARPADQLVNVSLTAADQVLWRYVSADGGWVMVRVPKFGPTDAAKESFDAAGGRHGRVRPDRRVRLLRVGDMGERIDVGGVELGFVSGTFTRCRPTKRGRHS